MIPYSYNMVDMGGIDLAEANRTVVPGIYEKIVEAMNLCGDLILYNWKFAGINIVPSSYTVLQQANSILINGMIQVTELDEITVLGIEPPILPVEPLTVSENGVYGATPPASGFNPVTVTVEALVVPLTVSENGTYAATPPASGFNPVTVNVDTSILFFPYINKYGGTSISQEVRFGMDYTFFGVAINGQAVTQQLNLAMAINGVAIEPTELYYSQASSTGDAKRNARIVMHNAHCSAGDIVQLAVGNAGSYTTIFIIGVPAVEVTEVTKAITTTGDEATGSYDDDGVCIYGFSNGQQKVATVDAVMYEADTTINGGTGTAGYGAGFIFWLK